MLGRPSTPIECYLRLMFLKFRYRLGYKSLCVEVSDSISWRRFVTVSGSASACRAHGGFGLGCVLTAAAETRPGCSTAQWRSMSSRADTSSASEAGHRASSVTDHRLPAPVSRPGTTRPGPARSGRPGPLTFDGHGHRPAALAFLLPETAPSRLWFDAAVKAFIQPTVISGTRRPGRATPAPIMQPEPSTSNSARWSSRQPGLPAAGTETGRLQTIRNYCDITEQIGRLKT